MLSKLKEKKCKKKNTDSSKELENKRWGEGGKSTWLLSRSTCFLLCGVKIFLDSKHNILGCSNPIPANLAP